MSIYLATWKSCINLKKPFYRQGHRITGLVEKIAFIKAKNVEDAIAKLRKNDDDFDEAIEGKIYIGVTNQICIYQIEQDIDYLEKIVYTQSNFGEDAEYRSHKEIERYLRRKGKIK